MIGNRALLIVLALPLFAFLSCTKTGPDSEQILKDFNHICTSQQEFLEARKLKGVNEAELIVERTKRMKEGLVSASAIKAVDLLILPETENKQEAVEAEAKGAGLDDWSCPALAEGP